jgi:hypothetical protein
LSHRWVAIDKSNAYDNGAGPAVGGDSTTSSDTATSAAAGASTSQPASMMSKAFSGKRQSSVKGKGCIELWPIGVDPDSKLAAAWLREHVRPGSTARVIPLVATTDDIDGEAQEAAALGAAVGNVVGVALGGIGVGLAVGGIGAGALASILARANGAHEPTLHCAISTTHTAWLRRRLFRSDLSVDVVRLGLSPRTMPPHSQDPDEDASGGVGSSESVRRMVSFTALDKECEALVAAEDTARKQKLGVWKEAPPPSSSLLARIMGSFRSVFRSGGSGASKASRGGGGSGDDAR